MKKEDNSFKKPSQEFSNWLIKFLLDLAYKEHYGHYKKKHAELDAALIMKKFLKLAFSNEFIFPRTKEGGGAYDYKLELGNKLYKKIWEEENE